MRYRDAGVDIERADHVKQALGRHLRATWGRAVRALPQGFAGVMEWPAGPPPLGREEARRVETPPLLLAATLDGVGTKLHLALAADRIGDTAADLVYHGANDLLVHGARPLAFLDYIAQERLDPRVILEVVAGLSRACREVGAALLGGETAEMPDTYRPGVVDVAGCMIGTVASGALLDGGAVEPGDLIVSLASSGLHTNGYSLARRVLAASGLELKSTLPGGGGESIGEALLAPHRWYGPALLPELEHPGIHALAHVTGGGIAGNLVRVLPEGRRARVRGAAWVRPAVFRWIIETGRVPEADARATFNLGVGMLVVCAPSRADPLIGDLERAGERAQVIGEVERGERGVEWMV